MGNDIVVVLQKIITTVLDGKWESKDRPVREEAFSPWKKDGTQQNPAIPISKWEMKPGESNIKQTNEVPNNQQSALHLLPNLQEQSSIHPRSH